MRKIFILPALLLLAFASCKKNTAVVGSITADIDGMPATFNYSAVGITIDSSGVYSISISGLQEAASNSSQLTIGVEGSAPIGAGTYTDTAGSPIPYFASLAYTQQPGDGLYRDTGSGSDTATVIITSISSSEVEGTFSGKLVLTLGSTTPAVHTITNGKFNVGLINVVN